MKQYKDQELNNIKTLIESVEKENQRQLDKWGSQTHSLFEWQNYLTEELGEVAKAIAEYEYRKGNWKDIYAESIQVATLALKIAEMIITEKE